MPSLSSHILPVLLPFATLFSSSAWKNALILILGAIICRGQRTVCAALKMMGLGSDGSFAKYHHILNRVSWSPLKGSRILLNMLLKLVGNGPLVIFVDETLERRRGPKIKAKGYYRDAVRSSKSITVKSSGLKWLVMSVCWKFGFSSRSFALPFMTVLQPSARSNKNANRRHKTTVDWTRQMLKLIVRWIGSVVSIIVVGDGGFACGALVWQCHKLRITLISRLKINARLYEFAPLEEGKRKGRKKTKGDRLFSFNEMVGMKDLGWNEAVITCYGSKSKRVRYIYDTHLWGVDGSQPVPIKWVLMVDPEGELEPLPLMSTDFLMPAERIIELYIKRWNLEVTFREVREHLGVETQRQWSDKAIARTTPVLMGLYTIICLIANRIHESHQIKVEQTAWYEKKDAAFSDLIRTVRRVIWEDNLICRKPIFESFLKNAPSKKTADATFMDNPEGSGGSFSVNHWFRMLVDHLAA
jgi:hypothetical protein